MKKVFLFACLIAATTLISWKKTANDVTVESLVMQWNNAWNQHDDAAISNLLSDNVELIAGRWRQSGKPNVVANFVKRNYKLISDLKTEKITGRMDQNIAYYFGTYTHNTVEASGNSKGAEKGNFTFIWEKDKNNVWKLAVIEIEEYPAVK